MAVPATAMKYEDRMRSIISAITPFIRRYKRPEHMDDATGAKTIRDIAESLNSRISASSNPGALADRVSKICVRVRETHRSKEWPVEPIFLKALDETKGDDTGRDVSGWKIDPALINSRRIKNGEPVGDTWIWGRGAAEIIERKLATREDMKAYERGFYESARKVYGDEVAQRMVREYRVRDKAGQELGPLKRVDD